MINLALIGKGYWGSKLEGYIRKNPNFNLECICNSKSNLEEKVWKNQEIKAVVVATPNQTHYLIVKSALLSGKHVLSEKPLALKTKECEELGYLSKEKNLILLTDYIYTFSKSLGKAKKIVDSGEIGNLKSLEMTIKQLGRFGMGNVYCLLGSHMLSVLDMFVPLKDLGFKKRDLVTYGGEVETGAIYFGKPGFAGQIIVSLNYPGKEIEVSIYGDKGTIIYNPVSQPSLQVETYKRIPLTIRSKLPKKYKDYEIDESNNLRYTIQHFYEVINRKKRDNVNEAVEITKILETIQKNK